MTPTTRRISWRPLAAAAAVTLLAGCATRSPAPGTSASDAPGLRVTVRAAGLPAPAGTEAGAPGTPSGAPSQLPVDPLGLARPSPKEFDPAAALRDVHFDFDRATIRPEDARVLDANARWLQRHAGALVLIEGHADDRGTSEYNLALAESRAATVREQLVARGVAPSRLLVVSYGEERPTCREAAETCWQRNRRAHFLVKTAVQVSDIRP
jgi:peptidoglycan-associated lipoprotein